MRPKLNYLFWYRDDLERPLRQDIEWALEAFVQKFGLEPSILIVPEGALGHYQVLDLPYKIVEDSDYKSREFGVM